MLSKMNSREKTLCVVLLLLVVGLGWYMLFYTPTLEKISSLESEQSSIQSQIDAAMVKKAKYKKAKADLEEARQKASKMDTAIPNYDNITNMLDELNLILKHTKNYSASFSGVSKDTKTKIVRRPVNLSFSCETYREFMSLLEDFYNSEYRCLVNNFSMSRSANPSSMWGDSVQNSSCSASVSIIYYEYLGSD